MSRLFSLYTVRHMSLQSWMVIIGIFVVFTNEYLIYWIQSWRWPELPTASRNKKEEMVILLASDPQIQGYQDEPIFPIGMFSRWDIDRFLSKTFSLAFHYTQPDVVVFLGDLMDEGSKATESEYESTLSRFRNIFSPAEQSVVIHIPGDNDVGGEGRDYRTVWKSLRFEENFGNITGVVNVEFIDFIKLDLQFHHEMPQSVIKLIAQVNQQSSAPLKFIINHDTLLPKMKFFIHPVLRLTMPNLILTGHWHEAVHYYCADCLGENRFSDYWPVQRHDLNKDSYVELDIKIPLAIHELMVPSCSYRMGKEDMGYGILIINKDGKLKFNILWLPHRYTLLYCYIGALVLAVTVFLIRICRPVRSRRL